MTRNSDRWVTPGVIVAGILTVGVVVLGVTAGLVYLAAQGEDPDPVLRLVVELTGSASAVATLLVSLASRQTVAKTERNTGVLARETATIADVVTEPRRIRYGDPHPPTAERGRAPAPPGRTPA
jgi:hypothetical protein